MTQRSQHLLGSLTLGAAATIAMTGDVFAHAGPPHVHSMAEGFAHPFTGFDHLLAMLAVGLWAGLNGGRALWAWPVAFVTLMLAGAGLGLAHVSVPLVETGILASVVLLGVAVAAAVRAPAAAGAVVIGAFAVLHGYAHGAELPAGASATGYMAGFALATALLHSIGLTASVMASEGRARIVVRALGALVLVAGLALAIH